MSEDAQQSCPCWHSRCCALLSTSVVTLVFFEGGGGAYWSLLLQMGLLSLWQVEAALQLQCPGFLLQ